MAKTMIQNTETIGQVYENYKASFSEESPVTEEQSETAERFAQAMESLESQGGDIISEIWESSDMRSRASEKAGFIVGFKMAMSLMRECMA